MLPLIAFLTSIAYLPAITSAAYAPRWWVLFVLAPIALMRVKANPTIGHWLGALFIFVCAESLFWSVSPMDTINGLIQLVALGLVFCIAAEQKDFEPVWLALGAGAMVNVAVALVNPAWALNAGTAGLFYQQDFFGAYCAVVLVGLLYGVRSLVVKPLLVGWCAIGLYLSSCRGAWLAAGVAVAVMTVRNTPRRVWWPAALTLTVGAMVTALLMYRLVPHRMEAVEARFLEWDWIVQNLHPWGWGFNTLGSVLPFEHADNDYVELAFELGLLSAVFYAFIVHALRGARHALPCFAVLCVAVLDGLTSFPFRNPATAMVAAIALGGLCSSRAWLRSAGRQGADACPSDPRQFGYVGSVADIHSLKRFFPAGPPPALYRGSISPGPG